MNTIWSMRDYVTERRIEVPGQEEMMAVRFATTPALLKAARELINLYDRWETQHFAYLNVNLDAFVFDSKTGMMTFKDNRMLTGKGMELTEEQRISYYSAPELVLGEETQMTDAAQNWTLAMLLFDLLYHGGHPLSGAMSHTQLFFDEKEEYTWYAKEGVFNMEEATCKNRPVYGIQGFLIKYWDYYPEVLKNAFLQTFLEGKEEKEKRLTPMQWKQVINEMENQMPCDCGYNGFVNTYRQLGNGTCGCPRCSKRFYTFNCGDRKLYISNETQILKHQFNPELPDDTSVVAMVVENKQRKGVYGMKNVSDEVWDVSFPNQSVRQIAPGQGAPIWPGLTIALPGGDVWSMKTEE